MSAEIQKELLELLKSLNEPKPKSDVSWYQKIPKIINSPFMLTVAVGGIVTIGSIKLEEHIARGKEERLRHHDEQRRKEEFVTKFSSGVVKEVTISHGMYQRAIWLRANQNIDRTSQKVKTFPDGRNFLETRDAYEATLQDFIKHQSIVGLLPQARVVFPELKDQLTKFEDAHDRYTKSTSQNELKEHLKRLKTLYDEIVESMATSI